MSELIGYTFRKAKISDSSELEKLIVKSSKKINGKYYSDNIYLFVNINYMYTTSIRFKKSKFIFTNCIIF